MTSQRQEVPGEYIPYYFEIQLDANDPLIRLDKLPPEVQRAYYHEFWHYLQNITTTYGVLGTWQAYDKLRQLLVDLHQQTGVLQLPLSSSGHEKQKRIDAFLRLQGGSGRLPADIHPIVRNGYQISQVEVVSDLRVEALFPGHDLGAVKLFLDHPAGGRGIKYDFGEVAISECMARMAEERHYGPAAGLERYPYRVAADLATREHPPVAIDDEKLFALCDVALMHPLPGYAFYELLQEMKKERFSPATGKEVIDYGMKKYADWGWNIEQQRDEAVQGLQYVVDKLYQDHRFAETAYWLKTIMVMGHNLRESDPYFALKVFRAKPFTDEMDSTWKQVGGPHCINKNWDRAIQVPLHLQQIPGFVDKIFPQRLRMIKQYSDLLTKGTFRCNSYDICKHSLPPTVDQRCIDAPWERASDLTKACPYIASWVAWGFHGRDLEINGQQVKT